MTGALGCSDEGPTVATFTEPYVESAVIEGLGVLHSRPEQEVFYEDGVFARHHPIAFVVQMAWDSTGYTHPLYVGFVNRARTRACLVGSRTLTYGGPATVEEDVEARTFVIQTHVPDFCGEEELGEGPYDVWIGANRYVAPNPAVAEGDTEAPPEGALALLESGNVLIFGQDEVTDLSGQDRGGACGEVVPGATAFERTDASCATPITVVDSPGSNILVDDMVLDSPVALLATTVNAMGQTVCVQDKGIPFLEGDATVGLYGQLPAAFGTDEVSNDLEAPARMIQRICPDDSGEMGNTRCDRGETPWIRLLVNPEAPSESEGWDSTYDAISARFPGAPPPRPAVDGDMLEAGAFDDVVDDASYLDLRQVPQHLVLPREACPQVRQALIDDHPGFVMETCVDTGGSAQDAAYGGAMDNCIRQTFEMAEYPIVTDVDPTGPPPEPASAPGQTVTTDDAHRGGWLSAFNTRNVVGYSYGDSDWAKVVFQAGYTVAGGTDGAYAGAYASAELSGEYDFDVASLEIYADAHDSSNADGSEAIFEATRFGISEGVGFTAEPTFSLRVSAFGGQYEKCVDEKFGWWVASVTIEGCASFTADVGGTLEGEFYLSNDAGNLEAVVGIVDVGPLIDASMDGSLQVGDGCCSARVSGALEPLAYLSIGNDFYLIGEVDPAGDLVSLTFTAALVDMDLDLIDGYVKLKLCFLGACKSTKLINMSGWSLAWTLYNWSISL